MYVIKKLLVIIRYLSLIYYACWPKCNTLSKTSPELSFTFYELMS